MFCFATYLNSIKKWINKLINERKYYCIYTLKLTFLQLSIEYTQIRAYYIGEMAPTLNYSSLIKMHTNSLLKIPIHSKLKL